MMTQHHLQVGQAGRQELTVKYTGQSLHACVLHKRAQLQAVHVSSCSSHLAAAPQTCWQHGRAQQCVRHMFLFVDAPVHDLAGK